jgi:hypothetical protein
MVATFCSSGLPKMRVVDVVESTLPPQPLSILASGEEGEITDRMVSEALASLEHYQRTGLHIRLDELKAWAQAVRKDRSLPMPECHT